MWHCKAGTLCNKLRQINVNFPIVSHGKRTTWNQWLFGFELSTIKNKVDMRRSFVALDLFKGNHAAPNCIYQNTQHNIMHPCVTANRSTFSMFTNRITVVQNMVNCHIFFVVQATNMPFFDFLVPWIVRRWNDKIQSPISLSRRESLSRL